MDSAGTHTLFWTDLQLLNLLHTVARSCQDRRHVNVSCQTKSTLAFGWYYSSTLDAAAPPPFLQWSYKKWTSKKLASRRPKEMDGWPASKFQTCRLCFFNQGRIQMRSHSRGLPSASRLGVISTAAKGEGPFWMGAQYQTMVHT